MEGNSHSSFLTSSPLHQGEFGGSETVFAPQAEFAHPRGLGFPT